MNRAPSTALPPPADAGPPPGAPPPGGPASPAAAVSPDTAARIGEDSAAPARHSYGQILKSSALIGGSSVLNIGIGIVRTKVMALILGPAGIGLLGLFMSIYELARSVAVMGLNSSGVREIAEAAGSGDAQRVARTVTTLRRVVGFFAALGALLLAALCVPVARLSFGDDRQAGAVALLALAVFFGAVSAGQIALVQGLRRIADLARANVLGALLGMITSVSVVWYFARTGDAQRGVVPALVCISAMTLLASWWFSRKIELARLSSSWRETVASASGLLKLGLVFMATGLMSLGVAYLIRIIVLRQLGVEAAGFYQAAWVLGGLYVGFILQAMGADFFPRLTAAAKDHAECNRLVNEQAEVSLLLAGPGILGTLTFAGLVIQIFYSSKFDPAVEVLRWTCLGMLLRVASWPMGFILLAKGARGHFFWSELAANLAQIAFVWLGVRWFGLNGTGIAFFASYLFYTLLIYAIVRGVSGFRWSGANVRISLLCGLLVSLVFTSGYALPPRWSLVAGLGITLLAGGFALRRLCRLAPLDRLPPPLQRLLVRWR